MFERAKKLMADLFDVQTTQFERLAEEIVDALARVDSEYMDEAEAAIVSDDTGLITAIANKLRHAQVDAVYKVLMEEFVVEPIL